MTSRINGQVLLGPKFHLSGKRVNQDLARKLFLLLIGVSTVISGNRVNNCTIRGSPTGCLCMGKQVFGV